MLETWKYTVVRKSLPVLDLGDSINNTIVYVILHRDYIIVLWLKINLYQTNVVRLRFSMIHMTDIAPRPVAVSSCADYWNDLISGVKQSMYKFSLNDTEIAADKITTALL